MARKTKNSSKATSSTATAKPTSSTASAIPSSKARKVKNNKIDSTATSSQIQPLSKQELAILCKLNKRNKASMSNIQAQNDKGMSWLLK